MVWREIGRSSSVMRKIGDDFLSRVLCMRIKKRLHGNAQAEQ